MPFPGDDLGGPGNQLDPNAPDPYGPKNPEYGSNRYPQVPGVTDNTLGGTLDPDQRGNMTGAGSYINTQGGEGAYSGGNSSYLGDQAGQFGNRWGGRMSEMARQAGEPGYWGDQQRGFGAALLAASQGKAPSAAEQQMRAGMQQAAAQGMALSRSNPGANPGLAMRQAQMSQVGGAMQTNQQAGILRAQEMAQARDAYARFMEGARQGDQQGADLQKQYMAMGMSAEQAAIQAQMDLERMRQQAWATKYSADKGVASGPSNWEKAAPYVAAGIGAAATIAGAAISDEREKKEISKAAPGDVKAFLAALKEKGWKYKDDAPVPDGAKSKRRFGPMAQDIEKAGPIGKSIVFEVEHKGRKVKALDMAAGFGAALTALGYLNKRMDALEEA